MYKISNYNIVTETDDEIVVYNSFTKASIFLEKGSSIDAFNSIDEFYKLSRDDQKILIDNGFVIDENRNELEEIKFKYEQNYYNEANLNIVLVPSLSCNFSCPYCFEKGLKCGEENVVKYFSILKKYGRKNFKKYNTIHFSLFGGEPLLFIKQIIEFLNWVKKDSEKNDYAYFTSIITNGSLLTEDILDSLLKHNLKLLQITIDSDKDTHNTTRIFKNGTPSYDILIGKANMVVEKTRKIKDFNFLIRINLTNTTVEKVFDGLSAIPKRNRNKVNLLIRSVYNTHAYSDNNKNNNTQINDYLKIGSKLGFKIFQESFIFQSCEACAGNKFFYLMPDLSVWKCINDLKFSGACIGKISDDGVLEYNISTNAHWAKLAMGTFADDDCLKCKKLPDCYGGCILYKCKHCKKQCRPIEMTSMFNTYE